MLRQLAKLYGVTWDKRTAMRSSPARSAPARWCARPRRFGVRQLVKLIPVYGQTAGAAAAAAASFAATYAMGKAASYFLARRQAGAHGEEVASVYRQALRQAFGSAKERDIGDGRGGRQAVSEPQAAARAFRAWCCWPWRCCCRR